MGFMPLPDSVRTILRILRENGFTGVVVGGCVRDACMGLIPHDFDMATDATPQEMLRLFAGFRVLQTGIAHGTVTILVGHEPIEVTTFRVDGDYHDHRHPSRVTFTTQLQEDLARRDLTINAMAFDGENVIDPFGGQDDVRARRIRCVGNPDKRFDEDGLRILRAMRFASILSFVVDPATAAAMHAQRDLLRHISAERIWAEFRKLLCGESAPDVLLRFADVLGVFLPQYSADGLRGLARTDDETVRLALLLQDTDAQEALRTLRADKKTIRAVTALLAVREQPLHRMLSVNEPRTVQAFWDLSYAHGRIGEAERDALRTETEAILREAPCLHISDLAVNGADLEREDLRGVQIGKALTALLNAVLDGDLPNEKNALLNRVRQSRDKN